MTPTTSSKPTSSLPASTTQTTEPTKTTLQSALTSTTLSATSIIESTTPQCRDEDCQCASGVCKYNSTLRRCQCQCQDAVYGDICAFGVNDTSAHIDTGAIPTRKTNFTLSIQMDFQLAFNDLNSTQSQEFINKLVLQLQALCKEADPQSFERVQIIKLSNGSVVAASLAEYKYLNNETQIQFVNTDLVGVLTDILNNTSNLNKISRAFDNSSVKLKEITFPPPEINNITDLHPYVDCTLFANYTAVISNGQWKCAGHCKTDPNYCNQHGECLNEIHKGPICRCYESSLQQFYGPRCEFFRRGPAFYGALFGSLAAVFLLLIVIIIAVYAKRKYTGIWKRSNSFNRRLSVLEDDFFDFSDSAYNNLGMKDPYLSEAYRPHLGNVDTQVQVTTDDPEVWDINP
ncbi:mucin-3A [Limanda limanda]|uniref:mucin-3A n=1 Tax=Limanda limanda TaxID=27771 RepID=UPI0029C9A562|nr:mucin-3A [Limanda limanda]